VSSEGRGLTTLTLDVATDVGTFGADVGPPPPPDVGTSGANAGGGGTLTWLGGRCGGDVQWSLAAALSLSGRPGPRLRELPTERRARRVLMSAAH
jgi:hypothetical protein